MTKREPSWVVPFRRAKGGAKLRLFCFPYAGIGASAYRTWPAEFDASIDVLGIQPPGREGRFTEPLFHRLGPLVDGLLPAILPFLEPPFAFFGHSLGTLVSFELCRRLRAAREPLPVHLFVSGRRAAQIPIREERLHLLDDAELIRALHDYNGTPAQVFAEKELLELVLPVIRADFAVHEMYEYEEGPPLDLPITAFGGLSDADVSGEHLEAWRLQTSRAFRRRMFPGDHFYLNATSATVAQEITADISDFLRP